MADDTFDIAVRLDPGNAVQEAKRVEESLARTERAAKEMRDAADAASRILKNNLASALHKASGAFGPLTEAIQREQRLLDMIHGPAQRFKEDLAALNKLHGEGKISAEQHLAALDKLGHRMETMPATGNPIVAQRQQTELAAQTIGFSSVPQGPTISPEAALGGIAAGLGALKAIDSAVRAWDDMNDRVIELTNSAQKFTSTFRDVNEVLDEQTVLASKLNATVKQTMEAYDAVADATDSLSISLEQQNRLTEILGKDAKLAGRSFSDVGLALQNVKVALTTGGDPAGQLRQLFRDYHDLSIDLQDTLGMTESEIIAAAKNGQLGYEKFIRSLVNGGRNADAEFKKQGKTAREWRAQQNEAFERAQAAGDNWVDSMKRGIDVANGKLKENQKTFGVWYEDLRRKLDDIQDRPDPWFIATDTSVGARVSQGLTLAGIFLDKLNKSHDEAAIAKAKALREEYEKIGKALLGGEDPVAAAMRKRKAEFDAFRADIERTAKAEQEAEKQMFADTERSLDAQLKETRERESKSAEAAARASEDMRKAAEDAAKKSAEAWGQGLGKIGADFISVALDGEQSFGQMAEHMLMDISKLILKMALMKAIQGGVSGGAIGTGTGSFLTTLAGGLLGGGANGFDYTTSSARLQLPGFATGGDAMVTGRGGIDSQLVMFRATPGESVHVRTPQQRAEAAQGSGGSPRFTVVLQNDRRDLIEGFDSSDGERVLVKLNRKLGRQRRD